jgi:hypothetical protein
LDEALLPARHGRETAARWAGVRTGCWGTALATERWRKEELPMPVLWLLVLLLIIFALVGGVAVNNWLFVILVIALVLALVGGF